MRGAQKQVRWHLYGYDGVSRQRVVAQVAGVRKVIAWGSDITTEELEPLVCAEGYDEVAVESVTDRAAEALAYPLRVERVSLAHDALKWGSLQ